MTNVKKLATASTIENLEKLINHYFYSTTCKIEGSNVVNSKGIVKGFEVVNKKQRYIFQSI